MTQEEMKIELEELAVRFSEGWHDGIKIDASDIMLLNMAAQALAQTQEPWCMKMNDCKTKCEDCPDEPPQRTEQEPVAWQWLDTAHFRKKLPKDAGDGVWNPLYAAPQRTERPVDCERCNRLEEQAYDLVGKLRVANIKLSMQPQRTWVGLTDEEKKDLCRWWSSPMDAIYATEAKLKEKNA